MNPHLLERQTLVVDPQLVPILAAFLAPGRRNPPVRLSEPMASRWALLMVAVDQLSGSGWAPAEPSRWITPQEAADVLGVSDRYVRALCDRRRILCRRGVSGRWELAYEAVIEERDARAESVRNPVSDASSTMAA